MCCTQLAGNTGRKNDAKILHLGTIAQLCRAVSSQLWCVSTIGKTVKWQYLLHMSSQYGKHRPTNGGDRLGSLGHPSKFQRVSRLEFITAATSLTATNQALHDVGRLLAATLYIHFRRRLPTNGILNGAKFTLRPSLHGIPAEGVSQTLRHGTRNEITELSQRAPPIFGWVAITLGIGTHFSYGRPM